ncbi:hypothetical protein M5D96_011657 [Drosophila gunungcola]|uniref:Uncharacterized protein n=1 Tax=Drosophila gunungcola TaxID=103775 RepID=A0A9P9YF28_9MUSC|nr:hypothetical protein M5D96_011657 [Drosophila gunungcola]
MKKEEWPPESKLLDRDYVGLKKIVPPARNTQIAKIRTTTGTATERKNGKRHRRIDGPGTKINAQCIHGAHTRAGWQYNVTFLKFLFVFREH